MSQDNPQKTSSQPDFFSLRLMRPSDLELFISYDKERYLIFLRRLNEALNSLKVGHTLKAEDYVPPHQYNIFVKLCCWLAFLSKNASLPPGTPTPDTYLEMLPDYSGITKKKR